MPCRHRLIGILTVLLVLPLLADAALFAEDFDDGTADGFSPVGPGWQVVDGTYRCETTGFEVYSSSLFGDPAWSDVSISFDIRAEDSVNHLLRLRVNDFEDYYQINLRAGPFHDVLLERVMNTRRDILALAPVTFAGSQWHHVDVVVSGHRFEVYLDGTPVLAAGDWSEPERLRFGQCAVVSYSGGVAQHQIVQYDNVVVEELTVPVAQLTLSAVKTLFD
jgi:hypothetical protein